MKTLVLTVALLCLSKCIAGPLTPTIRLHAKRGSTLQLGDIINEFALDMSEVLWREPGNVAFSPLSIASLMSLVMSGSSGTTYTQLRNALLYSASTPDIMIHSNYRNVLQSLARLNNDVTVNVATRLFLASGANILSNFTRLAQEHYGSSVRVLSFRDDPFGSMEAVNQWVRSETNGKIPQLITHPFDAQTSFVATNTVYFKGAWEHPFDPQQTQDGIFNTGSSNITVPMMRSIMTVPFVEMRELNAEMIALPYKGYEYGMLLIRPNGPVDDSTLQEVEFGLDAPTLNRYIGEMTNSTRIVTLPRMRLNFKTYLKNALTSLNVVDMFNPSSADFSRLTANKQVWVDNVIHQTVVEVNESGTEAAASTSISFNRIGTSRTFEVNRPSIFIIRHMRTGVPLFWGRIMSPDPLETSGF
ncbi:leukocyte elastase inhibitor A-like [Macrobrachium nipponense]|uniref:leukocyte elastase inhibitor A-like n=1 Tax=Macrobrachium nipponense TaxID=159736 RepID=UPI0030C7CA0E